MLDIIMSIVGLLITFYLRKRTYNFKRSELITRDNNAA